VVPIISATNSKGLYGISGLSCGVNTKCGLQFLLFHLLPVRLLHQFLQHVQNFNRLDLHLSNRVCRCLWFRLLCLARFQTNLQESEPDELDTG
jgi:hypothetical protein